MRLLIISSVLGLFALLVACGGGGGSSSGGGSSVVTSSESSSSVSSSSDSSSSESSSSESTSSASSESSSSSSSTSSVVGGDVCGVAPTAETPASAINLPTVKCISVDQFGYLPGATKIAILRNPIEGFDADLSYSPGSSYQLINLDTAEVALTLSPVSWKDGTTNTTSGDQVWWLDMSGLTAEGRYVLVDTENNVRSVEFRVAVNVYRPLLVEAVRTFYYQRAGFAKEAPFADAGWVDGASHLGAGQDSEARLYNQTGDASTERDLSGGWYDAGDYNKYTSWHASYLVSLMHTYNDRPSVFTDDFNLPESGNGLPDLVDEIKWGMDWLIKMQESNGSVLSIMGLDHASPPSAATGPSVYGPATTAASLSAAAAFALGAEFFTQFGDDALNQYATELGQNAEAAWNWADANTSVSFRNSDNGVAAGEQEVDDNGRAEKKLMAAVYLFADTGNTLYRDFVDANAPNVAWVGPWNEELMHTLLFYAALPDATSSVASAIQNGYVQAMQSHENIGAVNSQSGAYRAFLGDGNYTWGSSRTMGVKGSTFYHLKKFGLGEVSASDIDSIALGYINYLHGTNALGKVYLSNMAEFGAEDSVDSFYHSWFTDGSPNWDSVSTSSFGPAPGFVIGGANPQYNWDACCPDSCGSTDNNARCGMAPPSPPHNQPPMKSYLDFNDGWPINSWQVTENANGYQVAYIRLLSKFVE